MAERTFSAQLRAEHAALWQALLEHPFLRSLAGGELPAGCFARYVEQDYLYLVELARALAAAAARAETVEEIALFAGLLQDTLGGELPQLVRSAAALGLDRARLQRAEPARATQAYGDALVRVAQLGSSADLVAALLPCETAYPAIAERWRGAAPADPQHRAWLQACGSEALRALASRFERLMDEHAARASDTERARWRRHYRSSLRHELLFFEAAWRQERWPSGGPAEPAP